MTIKIPDIYIVTVDAVSRESLRFALAKTRDQIECAGWTHFSPDFFGGNSLETVQKIMWHRSYKEVRRASHILFMQYDGWVINGDRWNPDWLQYDYIGAPWPWMPDSQNVGNGGFSLRSVRLMRHLAENPDNYPVPRNHPEDAVLCQYYRPSLELLGFRCAPLNVAEKFSVERGPWREGTFGFHGIFNIPNVLGPLELADWKASANDYIRSKVEWKEI